MTSLYKREGMLSIVLTMMALFVVDKANGDLTIQGQSSICLNENDIVITCSVTPVTFVYFINMYTFQPKLGYVQIATIGVLNPNGQLTASLSNRTGVTLTGSTLKPTTANLIVTIPKYYVRRTDAAKYQCQSNVKEADGDIDTLVTETDLEVQITYCSGAPGFGGGNMFLLATILLAIKVYCGHFA